MVTRIKVCGITRGEDAHLAADLGASAVGFVMEPTSPRFVPSVEASRMARTLHPLTLRVAVFGRLHAKFDVTSFDAVQFVEDPDGLSAQLPAHIRILRMWRPQTSAETPPDRSGMIIIEPYSATQYGGTGKLMDAALAADASAQIIGKWGIAGGLSPETVGPVITALRPSLVDVSSGIEREPGVKCPIKMKAFFEAVRSADAV